jgi:hypothetical protein
MSTVVMVVVGATLIGVGLVSSRALDRLWDRGDRPPDSQS